MLWLVLLLILGSSGCITPSPLSELIQAQKKSPQPFLDPHNHFSGNLPWQAFADLDEYILSGGNTLNHQAEEEKLWEDSLAYYLHRPFSPRVDEGARAACLFNADFLSAARGLKKARSCNFP